MFVNIKRFIKMKILSLKFRKKAIIGRNCNISWNSEFEGMNQIYDNTHFVGYMGYGSYIASDSYIFGKIGRFCSIANRVSVNNGTHPYKSPFVSTSPSFFSLLKQNGNTYANKQLFDELRFVDDEKKYPVEIGNDVWIGEGVFIVGGVHIADGAMILAHAVVAKDVPPYAIVGGVPGKVVGYRYDDETIQFLVKTKWWNNEPSWFENNWELMSDIEQFKKYYSNKF